MKTETAKERILLAAGPIFAAKGFETATVREICRAADVNVASINYHFGDKKGLYTQTLFLARDLREQQVPLPAWTNEESADEKLKIFIELLLRRIVAMRTEPWEVRLLLREVMHPSDAAPPLIENYFRPFLDQLMRALSTKCLSIICRITNAIKLVSASLDNVCTTESQVK